MKKTTCDRCGAEIVKDENLRAIMDMISASKTHLCVTEKTIQPFIYEKEIDLCPACEKAVRAFIFGKEGHDGDETEAACGD